MTSDTAKIDALVSTVLLVRNVEEEMRGMIVALQQRLAESVTDYEIVVVDNASRDGSVAVLEELSTELPNLQVYCLSAQVSDDVARVAGIQQAIGDYVVLLDPFDDAAEIPEMLEYALKGNDLVVAVRADAKKMKHRGGLTGLAARSFIVLYRLISGYDLDIDASRFRLMSRRLVNYLLQHEDAYLTYLLLPMVGGFKSERVTYQATTPRRRVRSFREGVSYALSLIMFTSTVPLRLVTITCGLAALISVIYSLYVVLVYFLETDVVEGWTTLSLQLSLQFFLLALALGMLAEYMVHILRSSTKRPRFYIAREFRSGHFIREQKLNVRGE
ncbi:MAG: glycosyltransferase family 2 protein [Rhodospirillales bacterium]